MAAEPPYVAKGDPILASGWNGMVGSIKEFNKVTPRQRLQGKGAVRELCPFGELVSELEGTTVVLKLRGGVVICGDKNFNMDNFDIDKGTPREVFFYIECPVTANTDDDGQLLLPGVKTSSGNPVFKENATNYPNSTNPTVPTGDGIIIIPLGKLKVEEGDLVTFTPTGCGNIRIDHCGGSLTFTRPV